MDGSFRAISRELQFRDRTVEWGSIESLFERSIRDRTISGSMDNGSFRERIYDLCHEAWTVPLMVPMLEAWTVVSVVEDIRYRTWSTEAMSGDRPTIGSFRGTIYVPLHHRQYQHVSFRAIIASYLRCKFRCALVRSVMWRPTNYGFIFTSLL